MAVVFYEITIHCGAVRAKAVLLVSATPAAMSLTVD
jgi:hypothetical protein